MEKLYQQLKARLTIDSVLICFFFLGTFTFLYLTGTLISGYHFTDDHKILEIWNMLNNNTFLETLTSYIKSDFLIRFRPLYFVYYISTIKVFGANFTGISAFVGTIAASTLSFFYLGMRKLGHSYLVSVLFTILIFLGPQMAIWWKLGANETIAMFFLGLSFLYIAKCLETKNDRIHNILFIVFLAIASLCKESFIIVIPAFIAFKIWNEKSSFKITFIQSVENNILSTFLLFLMIAELFVIKFLVGTNQIGYAGVTSSTSELVVGIKNIVFGQSSLLGWVELVCLLLFVYLSSIVILIETKSKEIASSIHSLTKYVIFAVLLIIPNIFMHAKSGMVERYLVPTTFGISFFATGLLESTKQQFFRILAIAAIVVFLFNSFIISRAAAVQFANTGKDTNAFFSVIKKQTSPQTKILLVLDPVDRYEVTYSIRAYLGTYGISEIYGYPVMREYTTDFEKGLKTRWQTWFENKSLADMKNPPDLIVVFDKNQTDAFFASAKIQRDLYENVFSESTLHAIFAKRK